MNADCGQAIYDIFLWPCALSLPEYEYKKNSNMRYKVEISAAVGLTTKQEKLKTSYAVIYGSFMNNAVSMRIGRWRENASLSFKHRAFDIWVNMDWL